MTGHLYRGHCYGWFGYRRPAFCFMGLYVIGMVRVVGRVGWSGGRVVGRREEGGPFFSFFLFFFSGKQDAGVVHAVSDERGRTCPEVRCIGSCRD
ncbi:hypothetical protein SAICODRAFT_113865 [Saitoella complicata NRRL Y-17804]|uniref:uncharacterized protein n=1 Tax=Saitoella complicata (strain BCRC 22490 / CBS 7301 / JCM 7358 / NBRC 10748 / NRRL Y-17804) TaxID=698492 RepID=UPI0008676DBC|nr:uncharacterized protein SAICODRAFT_113865 [Saitoella complicata NRRL Y-17804]ODQ53388.1 hypothetical protein SAICODRAFT_113865 [Saitoella complicata NRRL Y-17804]